MSRSFKISILSCLFLVFLLSLLLPQSSSVSADATKTATSTPTPQGTPMVGVMPQSGHWEGSNPSISFDVTADGAIHDLKIDAPFKHQSVKNNICTYNVEKIAINTDGTFSATELSDFSEFPSLSSADISTIAQIAGLPGPDADGKYEIRELVGQFTAADTATGKVKIWGCEGSFASENTTTWTAKIVSLATEEATSASANTESADISPKPGIWKSAQYSLEFEVTTDQKIRNFKAVLPFNGDAQCTLSLDSADIAADSTFNFIQAMTPDDLETYLKGSLTDAQWQLVKGNATFPTPESDGLVAVQKIQGQFNAVDAASGVIRVTICGDGWQSGDHTLAWTANWDSASVSADTASATATP